MKEMNKLILPMQTIAVNSEAINTAEYEYETYRLRLEFHGGRKYDYARVPNHVFEGLRNSRSKGTFINRYIIQQYPFNAVNAND